MKFTYRPDIDGLRAIAVISVILYHVEFDFYLFSSHLNLFQGGFLGVDIFFVISGYLISFLLIDRIRNNSFTFTDFYERRARRILPILFLIIIVSFVAGWVLMMANQYKEFAASSISSLFFLSNFFFFFTDNYFQESSSFKPLLHTWSLSIEEQFYILFPPIIYFFLKNKINIVKIFLILFFISLLFSTFLSIAYSQLNFYILPSRIWEILAGSIMAFLHSSNRAKEEKNSQLLTFIGFGLIILSLVFFNNKIPNPSFFSSTAVIGTCLVIFYYNRSNFITKLLSNNLLVKIGLISYSLYLWHFPIFAFKKINSNNLSNFDKIELLGLIIFLSIMTFIFVEKPFRNKKIIPTKYFIILLIGFFNFLILISFYIYKNNGIPNRYDPEVVKLVNFQYDYSKLYQAGTCHVELKNNFTSNFFENCKTDFVEDKKNLYLWGDSLAAHLFPGIKFMYEKDYNIFQKTVGNCKSTEIFNESFEGAMCKKINNFILNEILNLKPSRIYISGNWVKDDVFLLEKLLIKLKKENILNIYVVGPSPRWHDPLPKILFRIYKLKKNIPKYLYDNNQITTFEIDKKLRELSKKYSIKYISPVKILCKEGYFCLTKVSENSNSILTWDENHFTEKGSIYLFKNFVD